MNRVLITAVTALGCASLSVAQIARTGDWSTWGRIYSAPAPSAATSD